MPHKSLRLLIFATSITFSVASQAQMGVLVRITPKKTCAVAQFDVVCSTVGKKLRELGTPPDANIHLVGAANSDYQTVTEALTSIRNAGYSLKLGYINSDLKAEEASGSSRSPTPLMSLMNLRSPFVDRRLADQIARIVIASKYPVAVLSDESPKVEDNGDVWLLTYKVVRWTETVELVADINSIPISIRKADAAIIDIFPHGSKDKSISESVSKRMTSDANCTGCHSTTRHDHSGSSETIAK